MQCTTASAEITISAGCTVQPSSSSFVSGDAAVAVSYADANGQSHTTSLSLPVTYPSSVQIVLRDWGVVTSGPLNARRAERAEWLGKTLGYHDNWWK